MKKFEFETSKGKFLLVDEKDYPVFHVMIETNGFNFYSLKEITEEQASEIVDANMFFNGILVKDIIYKTAIESLHSLLKSKGIHLFENPYDGILKLEFPTPYWIAEQKTFYNPYIFKL